MERETNRTGRWWHGFRAALAGLALASGAHAAGIVSLQNANNIGVVGLISSAVTISSATSHATLGLTYTSSGTNATDSSTGGGVLSGNVYYGSSSAVPSYCGNQCILDSSDLGPTGTLAQNAINDYTAASSLTSNQTISSTITGTTTISATGVGNVVSLAGINVTTANQTITISGTSADYFILQVSGAFSLTGTGDQIVLNGGVLPQNVLFVFVGTSSETVNIGTGGCTTSTCGLSGTLLSDNTHYTFNIENATINGSVIANEGITLDDAVVNGNFAWTGAPEPSTWGMLAAGLMAFALFRYYRSRRAAA